MQQGGELRLAQTSGAWDGQAHLTVQMAYGGMRIGQIALGVRARNQEYGDDERRTLQEIASVIARALTNAKGGT